ncbi:MAG: AAA family ATPase [Nannocystaceae bacterium]
MLRLFHTRPIGTRFPRSVVAAGAFTTSITLKYGVPDDSGPHQISGRNVRYRVQPSPPAMGTERFEVLSFQLDDGPETPVVLDGSHVPGWLEQDHEPRFRHCFIPAAGLGDQDAARLWDDIVLQGEEEFLIEALRLVAPDVDRVFFVETSGGGRSAYVRRKGYDTAEPVHSLGGGMLRLFELALGIVQARGGLLFVDEIENGLHYQVQSDLWSLIFEAAERFDVQVFATTHSWDCIEAFQRAATDHPAEGELIRLHRTETDAGPEIGARVVDEDDLAIVTRQAIEVR